MSIYYPTLFFQDLSITFLSSPFFFIFTAFPLHITFLWTLISSYLDYNSLLESPIHPDFIIPFLYKNIYCGSVVCCRKHKFFYQPEKCASKLFQPNLLSPDSKHSISFLRPVLMLTILIPASILSSHCFSHLKCL